MSFLFNQILDDEEVDCYAEIYISADFTAEINKVYVINADKPINIYLPNQACPTDIVSIRNIGNFPFTILQKEFQQIQIGSKVTTFGINGRIIADELGTLITLQNVIEDSSWIVTEVNSNILYE